MSTKKVVAIIQARVGSSRLPGKVLAKIGNRSLLEIIIIRLLNCKCIDEIMVATTTEMRDNTICEIASKMNVNVYRGSEDDVLSRFYFAACDKHADIIIRLTADNPMFDEEMLCKMVAYYRNNDLTYASTKNAPIGTGIELFSFSALSQTHMLAKTPLDREHVTTFMKSHPDLFNIDYFENAVFTDCRLTIDEIDDLRFFQELQSRIGELEAYRLADVLYYLKAHPQICLINRGVKQKKV